MLYGVPECVGYSSVTQGLKIMWQVTSSGVDCLEIYDEAHSPEEDRFIVVGPLRHGVIVVVYTERQESVIRILSARMATRKEQDRFEAYW